MSAVSIILSILIVSLFFVLAVLCFQMMSFLNPDEFPSIRNMVIVIGVIAILLAVASFVLVIVYYRKVTKPDVKPNIFITSVVSLLVFLVVGGITAFIGIETYQLATDPNYDGADPNDRQAYNYGIAATIIGIIALFVIVTASIFIALSNVEYSFKDENVKITTLEKEVKDLRKQNVAYKEEIGGNPKIPELEKEITQLREENKKTKDSLTEENRKVRESLIEENKKVRESLTEANKKCNEELNKMAKALGVPSPVVTVASPTPAAPTAVATAPEATPYAVPYRPQGVRFV